MKPYVIMSVARRPAQCTFRDSTNVLRDVFLQDIPESSEVESLNAIDMGRWPRDISMCFANDYESAVAIRNKLLDVCPHNTYMIAKSVDVAYREYLPPVLAEFTEQGLLPK